MEGAARWHNQDSTRPRYRYKYFVPVTVSSAFCELAEVKKEHCELADVKKEHCDLAEVKKEHCDLPDVKKSAL